MKYLYITTHILLASIYSPTNLFAAPTDHNSIIKTTTARQLGTQGTKFYKNSYYSDGSFITTQISEQEYNELTYSKEIPAIFKDIEPFPTTLSKTTHTNNTGTKNSKNNRHRQNDSQKNKDINNSQPKRANIDYSLANIIQGKSEDYFLGHTRPNTSHEGFLSGFSKGASSIIYQQKHNKLTPNANNSAYIGYYYGKISYPIFIALLTIVIYKKRQKTSTKK